MIVITIINHRYTKKVSPENIPKKESKTLISNCVNKSETITNTLSKISAKIQGGSPTDRNIIGDAVNRRFNRQFWYFVLL